MSMIARSRRLNSLALGLIFVSGAALAPATANAGFLDDLFGGGHAPQAQPSYNYQAPQPDPMSPDIGGPVLRPHVKKKVVVRESTPVRQKTTDLMHDKTLRPGDAIMMKDGVHVYNGPEAVRHSAEQFVPVDAARHVSPSARAALVAIDTTRYDPLQREHIPDTLASGRSAAVGAPISKGFKITDARGASVRYVGP